MTHRDPSQQRQHSHRVEDHLVDLEKFPEIIKTQTQLNEGLGGLIKAIINGNFLLIKTSFRNRVN